MSSDSSRILLFSSSECRKSLNGIGVRFQKKFPSYLQKGGKDRELAELVEQRLLECERKSSASHWDKVDTLLQKISLTKRFSHLFFGKVLIFSISAKRESAVLDLSKRESHVLIF